MEQNEDKRTEIPVCETPVNGNPACDTAPRKRARRPVSFYVAVGLSVLVLLALLGAWWFTVHDSGPVRDPNAVLGQLEGKTQEEIQAELDRVVEEGMLSISIASMVEFADGQAEGELKIENAPANRYLIQVAITRDDTSEKVYESGIIEPNSHIRRARLTVDLDAGEYPCTAVFSALDPDTEEQIGQAAAKIIIVVKG